MSESHVVVMGFAGLYVALLLVALAFQSRRASIERRLMRMSITVGLPVPSHLENELLRPISRRGRAWLLGNTAGVLVIAVPALLLAPDLIGPFGLAIAIIAFAAGAAASVGLYGSLAIVVATGVLWFDRRSAQHVQRRLWAEIPGTPHAQSAAASRA